MKKQIITLLTLMMAFASASFAEDEPSVQIAPVMDESEVAEADSIVKETPKSTISKMESKVTEVTEEVVDSVAADTAAPYVPYSEGLFFRPEVGGGKLVFSNRTDTKANFDITAGVNMGYQFNANFSIGWGISFYYSSMKLENFEERTAWNPATRDEFEDKVYRLPFYVSGRWKFTQKKLTPFVDGRFGYAVGLNKYTFKEDQTDPGITTENNGLYLEFGAGIQCKNFSVSVVLDRLACKDFDPEYRKLNGWPGIINNYHDVYIGLKLGYDFTFKSADKEEEEVEEENVFNSSAKKQ